MPPAVIAAGVTAAGAIGSSLINKSGQGKMNALTNAQTGLVNQQTSLGKQLQGQSGRIFNMSAPAYNSGLNYYRTLLGGSRGEMQQLMQPEMRATNELYQGGEKNIERMGMRGGARDAALADLNRGRVSQLASLIPGLRSGAAGQLMQGGGAGLGMAQGFGGAANTGFGNAGMTYANMTGNQLDMNRTNAASWSSLGSSLGKILLPWILNSGGGTAGAFTKNNASSGLG